MHWPGVGGNEHACGADCGGQGSRRRAVNRRKARVGASAMARGKELNRNRVRFQKKKRFPKLQPPAAVDGLPSCGMSKESERARCCGLPRGLIAGFLLNGP